MDVVAQDGQIYNIQKNMNYALWFNLMWTEKVNNKNSDQKESKNKLSIINHQTIMFTNISDFGCETDFINFVFYANVPQILLYLRNFTQKIT